MGEGYFEVLDTRGLVSGEDVLVDLQRSGPEYLIKIQLLVSTWPVRNGCGKMVDPTVGIDVAQARAIYENKTRYLLSIVTQGPNHCGKGADS